MYRLRKYLKREDITRGSRWFWWIFSKELSHHSSPLVSADAVGTNPDDEWLYFTFSADQQGFSGK